MKIDIKLKQILLEITNLFKRSKVAVTERMICIDIGYRNIKVIEVLVDKKTSCIHIENYGITTTPQGCIKNGAIKDVDKALEVISKVIIQQRMTAKAAKIIMSGTNIITRIYMMDGVEGEEGDVTVEKNVQSYLPVDVEEYRVESKILQTIDERGKNKYKVFLIAVPKIILKSYVEVLNRIGLKPLAIDIPANSTAKFFRMDVEISDIEDAYEKKNLNKITSNTFAVIDFGSETTIVNFLKDKLLDFNKVILCGSSNIDEHIAKDMEIHLDEAERLKKTYGLKVPNNSSPEEHYTVYETVCTYEEKLMKQIVSCFQFYQERCYGEPISKIFIIGGGSQLYGLRQYMFNKFRIPVYPVGLLNLKGLKLNDNLDREKLNYLINAVGISL
jgi:type IV pilus assembly protein PilM